MSRLDLQSEAEQHRTQVPIGFVMISVFDYIIGSVLSFIGGFNIAMKLL